jgi:hypothetical protein
VLSNNSLKATLLNVLCAARDSASSLILSVKVFLCAAFGFVRVRSARKRERSAQRLFYPLSAVCINMGLARIRECGVVV